MATSRAEIGRVRRERTRAALVEAALRVIARLGPDAPSIDDFTSEAGVARGTFYNIFETRDGLLIAVATEIADRIEAERAHLLALSDPAERLSCAVRTYIRAASANPVLGAAIVRIALVAAPLGPAMRANLARDLADGIAEGRFAVPSAQAAKDVVLGAGIMGMRAVLRGEAGDDHDQAVAGMVLLALGVPDAAEIAARPLPPPSPQPASEPAGKARRKA